MVFMVFMVVMMFVMVSRMVTHEIFQWDLTMKHMGIYRNLI